MWFNRQSLARFHAVGIAERRLQPEVFDIKIRPYSKAVNLVQECEGTKLPDVSVILSIKTTLDLSGI